MTFIVHTFAKSNLDLKDQLESCKDCNVYFLWIFEHGTQFPVSIFKIITTAYEIWKLMRMYNDLSILLA